MRGVHADPLHASCRFSRLLLRSLGRSALIFAAVGAVDAVLCWLEGAGAILVLRARATARARPFLCFSCFRSRPRILRHLYMTVTDRLRLRGTAGCVLGDSTLIGFLWRCGSRCAGIPRWSTSSSTDRFHGPRAAAAAGTSRKKTLRDVVVTVPSLLCAAACPTKIRHPAAVALSGRPVVPVVSSR